MSQIGMELYERQLFEFVNQDQFNRFRHLIMFRAHHHHPLRWGAFRYVLRLLQRDAAPEYEWALKNYYGVDQAKSVADVVRTPETKEAVAQIIHRGTGCPANIPAVHAAGWGRREYTDGLVATLRNY